MYPLLFAGIFANGNFGYITLRTILVLSCNFQISHRIFQLWQFIFNGIDSKLNVRFVRIFIIILLIKDLMHNCFKDIERQMKRKTVYQGLT